MEFRSSSLGQPPLRSLRHQTSALLPGKLLIARSTLDVLLWEEIRHMKVFLTGGTGFVGSHLYHRLLSNGHQVRALVRRRGTLPNQSTAANEVEGDLLSSHLASIMVGCDAVINLVGIIYQRGNQTFERIHHLGTRNLVKAAQEVRTQRFVQMSALGARERDASDYHLSKFAGEEEVRGGGIPFVILRPSLIFGPGSAFIRQMTDVMRSIPFVRPVAGSGEYRFRPIHVTDVVECFVQSLTSSAATGRTIDLAGSEELTLNQITDELAACMGVKKKAVHIPLPFMKLAASAFSMLPFKPPVTPTQLRMLEEGSTADPAPMKQIFKIDPIGFRAGLRGDLGVSRPQRV
jgi:uncharacterized protein YbjT (DUF2867 family)